MSVPAITATSIAINNAQNTKDAHSKCENFDVGYKHEGSTVEESVQYAQCINTLYPTTNTADLMVLKAASLTLLVCMIIGAVRGYREGKFYRFENVVSGVFGGALAGMSLFFIALMVLVLFL